MKITKTYLLLLIFFLFASITTSAQKKWDAPADADNIINPTKNDANTIKSGKGYFDSLCVVCHGSKGKGDGIAAAGLTPKPANLTTATFQAQSDGAIFWKIEQGQTPMPGYKNSISDDIRWEIINYIRTLKK